MRLKQLIIIVSIATAIFWISWVLVLFQVDPDTAGWSGIVTFYLTLFTSLLGSFFLITFGVRKHFDKNELEYKIVGKSFRQSLFFAVALLGILILQDLHFLTWWNFIILILGLGILEYFFININSKKF